MARVARLSRVILAAYGRAFETESSFLGASMANGTLGLFDSTSCREMVRDSNLYDLFMPATRPSRTTWRIQSWDLLGGSMVKCSPLNFLARMLSPSAGLIQKMSYPCFSTVTSRGPGFSR